MMAARAARTSASDSGSSSKSRSAKYHTLGFFPSFSSSQLIGSRTRFTPCQGFMTLKSIFYGAASPSFSASAMAVAQEVMASQSRKSPTGALTFLIIDFSMKFSLFIFTSP
jgi:hypothetical protein